MTDQPLSRQPSCQHCSHEEHIVFPCEDCLCPAHLPTGIYPKEAS